MTFGGVVEVSTIMFLGNKNRFAIQWEVSPDPSWPYLYGKACFWVGGLQIGNYEMGATLGDFLSCLKYPVGDCGNRHSKRLCNMKGKEVFDVLNGGLFDGTEHLTSLAEAESWARFNVSISIDVFDNWRFYLLDCESYSRLLVGRFSSLDDTYNFSAEQILSTGEYDEIIIEYQRLLEDAWESTRPVAGNKSG